MNSSVVLALSVFVMFFVYCQYYANGSYERFGGTAWFPRQYLRNVDKSTTETSLINANRNDTEFSDDTYEQSIMNDRKLANTNTDLITPEFGYFGNGNKYSGNREVSSLFASISEGGSGQPNKLLNTYTNRKMNETSQDILYKRGGNNG